VKDRIAMVLVSVAALAGCTAEAPLPAEGHAAPPVAAGGGTLQANRLFPERLCEALPVRGADIEEIAFQRALPAASGGAIVPGTYVLSALERFDGARSSAHAGAHDDEPVPVETTGRRGRVTLYVTGDALRFNESRAANGTLAAETTRGFSYRVADGNIVMTSECPEAGAKSSLAFAASADTLTLVVDGKHREVYARVSSW
jgi:hypothetical protein